MEKYELTEKERKLLDKGIIDLCGEVNQEMVFYVRACIVELKANDNPDIEILISSGGGRVKFGLDIYDMIRMYKGQTTGKVFQGAHSIAAIILQGCDKRLITKHSEIMIHHISINQVSLDVLRNRKKVEELKKDMERDQQSLYDILSEKTGHLKSVIKAKCAKEYFMSAEEALEFGLVDEII